MDLSQAIRERRTIKDFAPVNLPRPLVEQLLTAGTWAQNHRLTQPWRFILLGPETRHAVAELAADLQAEGLTPGDPAAIAKARGLTQQKIFSKPAMVAVSCVLAGDAGQRREDYAAVCCAIQNIHLAAWSEGLGMQWSTAKFTRDPRFHALLGLDPAREEIVGLLFLGYPNEVPPPQPRRPVAELLRELP